MKIIRSTISRSLATLAVTGLGLLLVAAEAQAQITFTVDEGAVTGANDLSFQANGLTGKYQEEVTCTPAPCGPAGGTFTAELVVNFTAFTSTTPPSPSDQIGTTNAAADSPSNEYGLYALVTVTGNYSVDTSGVNDEFEFEPLTSSAQIWTDPGQNTVLNYQTASAGGITTDDQHILSASGLNTALSFGQVVVSPTGVILGGFYALHYLNVTVEAPDGVAYLPTLQSLTLIATASGDVDPPAECQLAGGCSFPGNVRGDTSIAFNTVPVPEPASLTLLGMGLLGAGIAARRRRNSTAV